jgi:hypothetical protein
MHLYSADIASLNVACGAKFLDCRAGICRTREKKKIGAAMGQHMAILGPARRAAKLLTFSRPLTSLPSNLNGESNTSLVYILVMESCDSRSFVRAYIPKI